MFLREPQGYEIAGGGARGFGRALVPVSQLSAADRLRIQLGRVDWAPDLGTQIGSRDWWRGLFTMTALMTAGWLLAPGFQPLPGAVPAALDGDEWAEARTLAIAPLGRGADTGRRMAAGDLVRPLAEIPERPEVDLTATVGDGDAFTSVLQRAGVGETEAEDVAAMVSGASALGDIRPGTRIDLTLGRRPNRMVARPLERLAFRARFDLNLEVARGGTGPLRLVQHPIAIDRTPLRIRGLVGAGLYRAARAAGAPARAVEDYIKAMASRISIGQDVAAGDRFDLVIEQARAATGEVQLGRLLFAGLDHDGGKQLQLVRWQEDGREDWFDARGQIEHQGTMGLPVAGHVTSTFGWRLHPILGTMRMHKGMDIGAGFGSPIYAAMDGVVQMAGWAGGYGNFVKLGHASALQTGYGHMSRMAVRLGEHVRRGQVIGYVGSTGLSTGPHLHWEVWKNGVSIDPRRISFNTITTLSGDAMRAFRARVASLLAVQSR